ncbi:c-type cytochrome [Phaeodactylibacter luteus]|uniref:Cytochrome c n=1 Tax=Phaeodactylibacter luteus TaxID=1564516 RepID=A0A5C6RMV1_9BACT|nr:cytochrome c [Phaeodactylibacter luteus]TXB62702.1 cytochrome c [Phaeodactylibacter luteus]
MKWKTLLLSISFGTLFILASCRDDPYKQGRILYQNFCASCHMDDGSGLAGNIPPLAGADYVAQHQEALACIIRYGMEGEVVVNGTTYNNPMEGIGALSDFEITNVINYINHSWGNDYGYMTYGEVKKALANCSED